MSQQVLDVLKSIKSYTHVPLGGVRALVHEVSAHLRQIHGEPELVQAFATKLKASLSLSAGDAPSAQVPEAAQVEQLKKELETAAEELAAQVAGAVAKHAELQAELDKVTADRDDLKHGLELATQSIANHIAERDALQAKLDELSKTVPDAPEQTVPTDAPSAQPAAAEVDRSTTGQAAA